VSGKYNIESMSDDNGAMVNGFQNTLTTNLVNGHHVMETPGQRNVYYDENASFLATFGDAYSFRNLIEYLNVTNKEGTFVFSQHSIKYIQGVEMVDDEIKNPVLNEVNIDTSFLIEYQYESAYPEFPVRVLIDTLRCITRDIQKKNILCIYKVPGDDTIYLKIDGSESASDSQTNIGHLKPIRVSETKEFSVDDYNRPEIEPNCTIMASAFTRACTSFPHIGCDEVEIRGYMDGVTITAKIPNSTAGKAFRFGTVTDMELSEAVNNDSFIPAQNGLVINIVDTITPINNEGTNNAKTPTVKVPTGVMRSLSKINNLASNSSIKIFMETNLPLKIIGCIGNFGMIRVYVRSL
jgi:hypothetical protein